MVKQTEYKNKNADKKSYAANCAVFIPGLKRNSLSAERCLRSAVLKTENAAETRLLIGHALVLKVAVSL
jgi:hypothetical protein